MVLVKSKFSKKSISSVLRYKNIGFNINSMQDWYELENNKKNNVIKFNINSMQDWYELENNKKKNNVIKFNINSMQDWYKLENK